MLPISESDLKKIFSGKLLSGCIGGDYRDIIKSDAILEEYEINELILDRNTKRRAVGILVSGRLTVSRQESGDKAVLLNHLVSGDCFGVSSVFSGEEDFITVVRAKTKAKVIFLSEELLLKLIRAGEEFAVSYISFLTGRIRFLNKRIHSFTAPKADKKLAAYLLENGGTGGKAAPAPLAEIARRLSMGRASLYRAIDTLEQAGAIKKDGKSIEVLSEEILREIN
jgi:CRP-like cAMP-binding protein